MLGNYFSGGRVFEDIMPSGDSVRNPYRFSGSVYIQQDDEGYITAISTTPFESADETAWELPDDFDMDWQGCYQVRDGEFIWDGARKADEIAQRQQREMQEALERTRQVRVNGLVLQTLAPALTDAQALTVKDAWPVWTAGGEYAEGEIAQYGDGLYRVMQAVAAQAHQPPDAEGMLAVYKPIQIAQEGEALPWVEGEHVEQGQRRRYEGVVYECVQADAGANVHAPPLVPAVWTEVAAS